MNNSQQPFEPDHLIRLVHAQYPHRTDVLRALQLCSGGNWANENYIYFISSLKSAVPNDESRIVESIVLKDHQDGRITVDVVADGRIARIGYDSKQKLLLFFFCRVHMTIERYRLPVKTRHLQITKAARRKAEIQLPYIVGIFRFNIYFPISFFPLFGFVVKVG